MPAEPPPLANQCQSLLIQTLCNARLPSGGETDKQYGWLVRQFQTFPVVAAAIGSKLLHAIISTCPDVLTDDLLLALLPGKLRSISLPGCVGISLSAASSAVERCRNLTSLNLSGCEQLAGLGFVQVVTPCTNQLVELDLSNCDSLENGCVQLVLEMCGHLLKLDVSFCHSLTCDLFSYVLDGSDDATDDLSLLPGGRLQSVSLSGCAGITSQTVRHLMYLCEDRLQELDISWCSNVDSSVLWYLGGLSLQINEPIDQNEATTAHLALARLLCECDSDLFLWLDWLNILSKQGFTLAARRLFVPALTALDLSGIDLDVFGGRFADACFCAFAVCAGKSLQRLSISSKDLEEGTLAFVAQRVPNLSSFSLVQCIQLEYKALAVLAQHCPKLEYLDLKGASHVGDEGLSCVCTASCNQLRMLSLGECCITDSVVPRMVQSCASTLEQLDVSWCEDLTDEGLAQLCMNFKHLRELHLRRCAVDSCTLFALTSNCNRHLHTLNLSSASTLTNDEVVEMSLCLPALQVVDISWNSSVGNGGISSLLSNCTLIRTCCLDGLKLVTSEPLLPIVMQVSASKASPVQWTEHLQQQLEEGMLEKDVLLLQRSTVFATHLRVLSLQYCDLVNDCQLAMLSLATRGTVRITNYYGDLVNAMNNIRMLSGV